MIELYTSEALNSLLFSLVLGVFLCVIYDLFSAVRLSFSKKIITFLSDFSFCILSAVAIYLFLIAFLSGEFRAFALIGIVVGFFVFRVFLSPIFRKILLFFARILVFMVGIALKPIKYLIERVNLNGKVAKKLKKLLKNTYNLLYNIFIRIKFRGRRVNGNTKTQREEIEKYFD